MRVGQYEVLCHRCQPICEPTDQISRPAATPREVEEITWRLHSSHTESSSGGQRCYSRMSRHSGCDTPSSQSLSLPDISRSAASGTSSRMRRPRSVSPSKASSISARLHRSHTRASSAKVYTIPPPTEPKYSGFAVHLLEFQRQRIRQNNGDPALIRQYDLYSRPQWSPSLKGAYVY